SGAVEEYDAEKQKVKISILIFGRATSVELDISQVEKVS
ncbi:MAG: transcription termination/antitermination protein NusG, partial [Rickettsiales bacterium]|nr:transcription termination/antitermination protein NusG [Rickettsiales bacterium]